MKLYNAFLMWPGTIYKIWGVNLYMRIKWCEWANRFPCVSIILPSFILLFPTVAPRRVTSSYLFLCKLFLLPWKLKLTFFKSYLNMFHTSLTNNILPARHVLTCEIIQRNLSPLISPLPSYNLFHIRVSST